ncbi:MAG: hypothetical protein RLN69_06865, partial [Woeseiaceae bacterium]
LYATQIADAVLDGKASLPQVALGEDDFVELDEDGKPKKSAGRRKKASSKPAAKVTRKAPARKVEVPVDEDVAAADAVEATDVDDAADDADEAAIVQKAPAKKASKKKVAKKKTTKASDKDD